MLRLGAQNIMHVNFFDHDTLYGGNNYTIYVRIWTGSIPWTQ